MWKTSDFHPSSANLPSFFRASPDFPSVVSALWFSPSCFLIKTGNVSGAKWRISARWMPVDGRLFPGKSFPLNAGKLFGVGQPFFRRPA